MTPLPAARRSRLANFPSFHPRRTFHASRDGEEFFELLGTSAGPPALRRWRRSIGRLENPLQAPHSARLLPAGYRQGNANFALVRQGQLLAIWCPGVKDSVLQVHGASPIRNVFKIVACGDRAAFTLSRERLGSRINVVCTDSARVLQTVHISEHLLDVTLSSCGQRLLWIALNEESGSFSVVAQAMGGTERAQLATYPNDARAPFFTTNHGANGLMLAQAGDETLLVDPICNSTRHSWPSRKASIEHVAVDRDTQRPWIWCETGPIAQRWRLADGDAMWLDRSTTAGEMHLRLAATLDSRAVLLENVGFNGCGDLYVCHRSGGEPERISTRFSPKGRIGLRVRRYPDESRTVGMWQFESIAAKPKCCLILFHGGPAAKDDDAFDPWVMALASLGVLVVKANYPGSYGCGDELHRSNTPFSVPSFLVWAGTLMEALRSTQAKGETLPVFVGGWSFGGYLALLTAAASPDRVEGVLAISAPFDLGDVTDELAPRWRFARKSLERILGSTTKPDFRRRLPSIDASTLLACRRVLIVFGSQDDRIGINDRFRKLILYAERQEHIKVLEFEGMGHFLNRQGDIDATLDSIIELISPVQPSVN